MRTTFKAVLFDLSGTLHIGNSCIVDSQGFSACSAIDLYVLLQYI